MTVVGQVEIDPFRRAVLSKHWPGVPKHDDVRTAVEWWRSEPRPVVDVVAGGYPCQPESLAGRRLGHDDERWLWPDFARVVHAIRPRYVIGENVMGHRTRGLRFVLRDLERLGYVARAGAISACAVGAPHTRSRLFVLAYAHGARRDGWRGLDGSGWPNAADRARWQATPRIRRVADGLRRRLDGRQVDRLRALGDAVVPAMAEAIGQLVMVGAGENHSCASMEFVDEFHSHVSMDFAGGGA